MDAVPGSSFSHYETPATPTGAAQIVVSSGGHMVRVYVHPVTLMPMSIERDDHRVMELVSHLHGQLLLGDRGSMIVELAGSWGVVMILTGLYLWLPRGRWRLGGVVYPRLGQRGRQFWRDLHAVAGLWISIVTLFLLLSGLPWSANWGHYLTWVRNHWSVTEGKPDWPIGAKNDAAARAGARAQRSAPEKTMPGMDAAEMAAMMPKSDQVKRRDEHLESDLAPLDRIIPVALRLDLPRPVWVSPPTPEARDWTIASKAQNRPLRRSYTIAPDSGIITGRSLFAQKNIFDRIVNVAVATHEGQLFGRINQAILLLNAFGVLLVSVSAIVMGGRRRPAPLLGAPPRVARPHFPAMILIAVLALALLLPLFGASLLLVLLTVRTVLRHLPKARHWLGLPAQTV